MEEFHQDGCDDSARIPPPPPPSYPYLRRLFLQPWGVNALIYDLYYTISVLHVLLKIFWKGVNIRLIDLGLKICFKNSLISVTFINILNLL